MRNYNYKKIAKNVIAVEIAALKKLNKSFDNSFTKPPQNHLKVLKLLSDATHV